MQNQNIQNLTKRTTSIDTQAAAWQTSPSGFNQPPSRGKLAQSGEQAAKLSTRLSGVFTLAYPLVLPFAMVGRGKVRHARAGSDCQFSTPCPLSAAHRVETESGKKINLKGTIMPQARKGFLKLVQQSLIPSIDTQAAAWQTIATCFNQQDRFSSLNSVASSRQYFNEIVRIFYACISPSFTFSNGKQGRGATCPLVHVASLLTRLLFPAYTFSSVKAVILNRREKVNIMPKIRQGFSSPLISRPIHRYPNYEAEPSQIHIIGKVCEVLTRKAV